MRQTVINEVYVWFFLCFFFKKKVSEYDQEIPQSQTADNPVAPRGILNTEISLYIAIAIIY